jgi:hypothetical protein
MTLGVHENEEQDANSRGEMTTCVVCCGLLGLGLGLGLGFVAARELRRKQTSRPKVQKEEEA